MLKCLKISCFEKAIFDGPGRIWYSILARREWRIVSPRRACYPASLARVFDNSIKLSKIEKRLQVTIASAAGGSQDKRQARPNKKISKNRKEVKTMKNATVKMEWIVSKAAAQAKNESAKESIFAACYEKDGKALDNAIKEYNASKRALDGWTSWIDSDDESRAKLAREKSRNACIKFSQRIGKSPAGVLQFAEDAAQESLLYIYYEMEDASERAPESILSFIAGKYISSYYYRSTGRNGNDDSLEEYENIDAFLYGKAVFGPGPESALLELDTMEEIISEIKPKYQEESRIIIDALKAGYNQSEIASALGTSQQVINYRLQQIKAAARIVTERDKASASLEKAIQEERETEYNNAIYRRESMRK